MADPPPDTGTPRWVKVFGIIALVVVLLVVILLFTRGPGGHGPGDHTPSGGSGGQMPPSSVIEDQATPEGGPGDHTPPEGGHG
jgi:hypothetical protein